MLSPRLNPSAASPTSMSVSRGGYPRGKPQPPHLRIPITTCPSHLLSGHPCQAQRVPVIREGSELSPGLARALHLLLTPPRRHPPRPVTFSLLSHHCTASPVTLPLDGAPHWLPRFPVHPPWTCPSLCQSPHWTVSHSRLCFQFAAHNCAQQLCAESTNVQCSEAPARCCSAGSALGKQKNQAQSFAWRSGLSTKVT